MRKIGSVIAFVVLIFGCGSPEKIEEEKVEGLKFSLDISKKGMKQLNADRDEALENKVLISDKLSWVKADLSFGKEKIPVKVRLKGDWTDHLKGNKWSLRVKVKGDDYVMGMKEFSFQTPETRGDLNEWVYHQLLEKEDILTTKYEFCELKINGIEKGVYAIEEHFTKLLLERQKRREGPIVKFNENPLWQSRVENEGRNVEGIAFEQSANVDVFSKKKTINNPVLQQQYQLAKNLMYQNQFLLAQASKLYDVERLAKFLAIMDITKSYHGWHYHNQRWYYNGITGKLEPIGFDGYMAKEKSYWEDKLCIGCINDQGGNPFLYSAFSIEAFKDSLFVDRYFYYVEQYFNTSYLDKFFNDIATELAMYEALIQTERVEYKFELKELSSNLEAMKKGCAITDHRKTYASDFSFRATPFKEREKQATPVNNATLMVYDLGGGKYKLLNVHFSPVKVLGIGNKVENIETSSIEMKAFTHRNQPIWESYSNTGKGSKIFYSVEGIDSVFFSDIIREMPPEQYSPMQELDRAGLNAICKKEGNKIIIPKGSYQLSDNIIIPKGFVVDIEAGTTLDLINEAKFISYSPVFALGSATEKITITSSDGTANGVTILQADQESELRYVDFSNLNTLNYKGWILTGAVSFYESDVTISNCSFSTNKCEDALNIIRSTFLVDSSSFDHVYSDAFDGDFCIGKVLNSTFENIGNDAIDFSGSDIYVENCQMINVGDKGISIGENSSVEAVNTSITTAALGISAKDLSKGKISNVTITNCQYGFAIYQKKPEFGPASIVANEIEFKNVENEYVLDKDSKIDINGKDNIGDKKIDIDALFY